jgi:hypothetical protein
MVAGLKTFLTHPKLINLIETIGKGGKVAKADSRILELAERSKAYTSSKATRLNSRDDILRYITDQIEKVNKLGGDDATKKAAAEEMWMDYQKMQDAPDGFFGRKVGNSMHDVNTFGVDNVDDIRNPNAAKQPGLIEETGDFDQTESIGRLFGDD